MYEPCKLPQKDPVCSFSHFIVQFIFTLNNNKYNIYTVYKLIYKCLWGFNDIALQSNLWIQLIDFFVLFNIHKKKNREITYIAAKSYPRVQPFPLGGDLNLMGKIQAVSHACKIIKVHNKQWK